MQTSNVSDWLCHCFWKFSHSQKQTKKLFKENLKSSIFLTKVFLMYFSFYLESDIEFNNLILIKFHSLNGHQLFQSTRIFSSIYSGNLFSGMSFQHRQVVSGAPIPDYKITKINSIGCTLSEKRNKWTCQNNLELLKILETFYAISHLR